MPFNITRNTLTIPEGSIEYDNPDDVKISPRCSYYQLYDLKSDALKLGLKRVAEKIRTIMDAISIIDQCFDFIIIPKNITLNLFCELIKVARFRKMEKIATMYEQAKIFYGELSDALCEQKLIIFPNDRESLMIWEAILSAMKWNLGTTTKKYHSYVVRKLGAMKKIKY